MNNSTKILIASFIILACSIGFFTGSIFMNPYMLCKKTCPMVNNEQVNQKHIRGPHTPYPQKGDKFRQHRNHKKEHRFDFHKNKQKNIAEMDSVMQVTPEQKKALAMNRTLMDSIFIELNKQKKEAVKYFRDALEEGDTNKINSAKTRVLATEESILTQRAICFAELAKILSPEQREKFRAFRNAKFQK